MKKYIKLLLLLIVITLLGLGFWNIKQKNVNSNIPNEKTVREFKANLTINNGKTTESFDATNYVGKTVLEATKSITNGKVVTKGEKENAFVTSINEKAAEDSKREFWELVINGLQSPVGAGTYIIKEGDQIEWHINNY